MIFDTIENAEKYTDVHKRFKKAFEILCDPKLSQQADGQYNIDGEDIYLIVQTYTTKAPQAAKFEAHRKYIDVQFLLSGEEAIGWENAGDLKVVEPYQAAKDVAFFQTPEQYSTIHLRPGLFCVLFPNDAHMPAMMIDAPTEVRKAVIKIRVE